MKSGVTEVKSTSQPIGQEGRELPRYLKSATVSSRCSPVDDVNCHWSTIAAHLVQVL